jgi:hypothetical protein
MAFGYNHPLMRRTGLVIDEDDPRPNVFDNFDDTGGAPYEAPAPRGNGPQGTGIAGSPSKNELLRAYRRMLQAHQGSALDKGRIEGGDSGATLLNPQGPLFQNNRVQYRLADGRRANVLYDPITGKRKVNVFGRAR